VARRLAGAGDDGALVYRRRPAGEDWSSWAEFQPAATLPEAPWIVAEGRTLWRAWRSWNPERGLFAVHADTSEDGGITWSEAGPLARAVQPYERPALASGGGFSGAWWSDARASGDAPAALHIHELVDGAWQQREGSLGDAVHVVTEPTTVRAAAGVVTCFAAIAAAAYDPNLDETPEDNPGNQDRDIWCYRGEAASPSLVRLTDDPGVQYWPALTEAGDGSLLAAWSTRAGLALDGGAWSVVTSRSTDGGATWSAPAPAPAESEAWRPALAGGEHGEWLAAVEVAGGRTTVGVYTVVDGVAERRATALESAGWVEDVQLIALPEGLWLGLSVGTDTQVHRIYEATLPWTSVAAPADTGVKPEDCLGCGGQAAAPLLLAVAAWRRRRRR
jgi:uncharacterized protein (TIGR03382 family)